MTKYSRKCRRIGSMAKTSNVAQRRIKKRTTRKKRGGGNVFSTSEPIKPIEPITPLRADFLIVRDKIFRYAESKIYKDDKLRSGAQSFANDLVYAYLNFTTDYFEEKQDRNVYMQRFLDVYNKFCKDNPEICRIYDYPDDIMNLEFADDKFQDRDEVINYLLEKDPNIFKKFKEDAFNEALAKYKLTSQGIPESQELGGGRRKKTTRKKRG